jgi:probable F420-dependent oxidoreductase
VLRIGLLTPAVCRPPAQANPWENDCSVDDLVSIVQTADLLGFDHLTCSDHTAIPVTAAAGRGSTYWDPAATLAFIAAHTRWIKLATHVLVLGYRHPLQLVKQFSTVDRLSNGRVILGLGVGSLRAEFELLGAEFENRGSVADDAVQAIRASWGERVAAYHGDYFDFAEMVVDPTAVQRRVPLWFGGSTARSLRRAINLGDGWVPFGLDTPSLGAILKRWELPERFDVVLEAVRLDAVADAARVEDTVRGLFELGAAVVNVAFTHNSPAECIDQMTALAELLDMGRRTVDRPTRLGDTTQSG